MVVHLHAHDVVDELLDAGRRHLLQRARRGLDRVRDHHDRRFARARTGTGVAVALLRDLALALAAHLGREPPEVLDGRRAVVLLDEGLDRSEERRVGKEWSAGRTPYL